MSAQFGKIIAMETNAQTPTVRTLTNGDLVDFKIKIQNLFDTKNIFFYRVLNKTLDQVCEDEYFDQRSKEKRTPEIAIETQHIHTVKNKIYFSDKHDVCIEPGDKIYLMERALLMFEKTESDQDNTVFVFEHKPTTAELLAASYRYNRDK